jgi:homospermidine synthase
MSYEPMKGKFTGTCIPHAESYSLAKLLRTNKYCPSIYYSYLMCNDAKLILNYAEFALDKDDLPKSYHILRSDEIVNGYDSVGCLFYFNNKNKGKKYYWYGSILDNEFAKTISPEVNATTIQVAISIYAAILWMQENPKKGILEPEELDTDFVLNIARPYLGDFYYKDVSNEYKPPGDTFYDLVVLPNSLFK